VGRAVRGLRASSAWMGVSWLLPRAVGQQRALELALTGRALTVVEAHDWGLVTEVVDDEQVAHRTHELARELADGRSDALGESCRLIRAAWEPAVSSMRRSIPRRWLERCRGRTVDLQRHPRTDRSRSPLIRSRPVSCAKKQRGRQANLDITRRLAGELVGQQANANVGHRGQITANGRERDERPRGHRDVVEANDR